MGVCRRDHDGWEPLDRRGVLDHHHHRQRRNGLQDRIGVDPGCPNPDAPHFTNHRTLSRTTPHRFHPFSVSQVSHARPHVHTSDVPDLTLAALAQVKQLLALAHVPLNHTPCSGLSIEPANGARWPGKLREAAAKSLTLVHYV